MAANDFAAQNGTEKLSTNALATVNGINIAADLIEVQRVKPGYGVDGDFRDVSTSFPLPVQQPDITASGTLAAAGQLVNLPLNGQSSASVQITGVWTGTITFEGTVGGVAFDPINGVSSSTSTPASSTTVNGTYRLTPGALASLQAKMSTFGTGSATISIRASSGAGGTFANQILPTKITDGTNTATIKPASTAAAATDLPLVVTIHPTSAPTAPQPVSAASLPLPAGAGTETTLAGVRTDLGTDGTTPPAVLGTGTGVRGWLRSIYEKLTGSIAVTGAFFQATQPVSLATNTPDVTDRSGRLLGTIANTGFAVTNAGTFAVQSAATLAAETNKVIGTVNLAQTTLWVTATAASGVAATASLPAAGAGLFHYITAIDIQLYATAARTGGATPTIVTSTNISGSPAWNFPSAQVIGAIVRYDVPLLTPAKSSVANTITTVAAPIATTGLWRINVGYYTAP